MITTAILLIFFGLLFTGIPIFALLILAGIGGFLVWGTIPFEVVPQRLFTGLDSFVFIAIPFFIMTGVVMERAGLAQRLLDLATALIGTIRGGLAIANVMASMLFAGVTGAASADTASVGSVMIPGMIKRRYDADFSVAITITSSTIGVLIPPSIPMVIYGVITNTSVAELFVAGLLPGMLIGLALMWRSYATAVRRGYPTEPWQGWGYCIRTILAGLPPLTIIVIIFGGIIGGVFTPTEAAVAAAIYAIFLALCVYRTLSFRDLAPIFVRTAALTSLVALLIAASNVFSWLLAAQQVPAVLRDALLSFTTNDTVILLVIAIIYLIVGMVIDLTPAMLLLVPIFLPLVQALGIDLTHFGIITVMALAIGLYTPPVGTCLAVGLAIHRVPLPQITQALIPFFLMMVSVLALVIVFPGISLYLVELLL
jgi:tripartite ATP-independent transporter DctM subunit